MIKMFDDNDFTIDSALFDGIVDIDPNEIFIDPISNTLINPFEDWPIDPFPSPPDTDQSCDIDDVSDVFSGNIPLNKKEWLIKEPQSRRYRAPRLLEFLILLLSKAHYESYASFSDRSKGLFQIHQPGKVAELWQAVKSRQSSQKMTYDKFARGVRWLYKSKVMQKTNTRYTFQFSSKTLGIYFIDENNNIPISISA